SVCRRQVPLPSASAPVAIELGQRARLVRARKINAQPARKTLRGHPVTLRTRDAHTQHQQVGCGLEGAEEGVDLRACIGQLAALEFEVAELEGSFRKVRPQLQRLPEILAGLLVSLGGAQTNSRIG